MASLPAEVRELMLRTELPKLGVLHIDSDYLSTPGDIGHPESYAFPVVYRVVPGLTFDAVQSGKLTPRVEADFIDAVKYLDAQGVSCITGDCGFFFWFTELAKKHTTVPVVLSTLMLIPTLTKSLSDTVYIAILTSNGKSLEPMRPLIKRTAGVDLSQERFIILGCEDVEGFDAVAAGSKVDVWRVTLPLVRLALQSLVAEPRIKAIVCECTQLPPFGDALRAYTGLPVYTSITACNMAMEGLLAQNLTLSSWQDVHHKHATEPYTFGQELTEEQRSRLVTRTKNTVSAGTGQQHRMDYMKDVLLGLATRTGLEADTVKEAIPKRDGKPAEYRNSGDSHYIMHYMWHTAEATWELMEAHAKNLPSKPRSKLEKIITIQKAAAATNPAYVAFKEAW